MIFCDAVWWGVATFLPIKILYRLRLTASHVRSALDSDYVWSQLLLRDFRVEPGWIGDETIGIEVEKERSQPPSWRHYRGLFMWGQLGSAIRVKGANDSVTATTQSLRFCSVRKAQFVFPRVFLSHESNTDVYEVLQWRIHRILCERPVPPSASWFALGRPKTGSASTTYGTHSNPGLLPRMVRTILAHPRVARLIVSMLCASPEYTMDLLQSHQGLDEGQRTVRSEAEFQDCLEGAAALIPPNSQALLVTRLHLSIHSAQSPMQSPTWYVVGPRALTDLVTTLDDVPRDEVLLAHLQRTVLKKIIAQNETLVLGTVDLSDVVGTRQTALVVQQCRGIGVT